MHRKLPGVEVLLNNKQIGGSHDDLILGVWWFWDFLVLTSLKLTLKTILS